MTATIAAFGSAVGAGSEGAGPDRLPGGLAITGAIGDRPSPIAVAVTPRRDTPRRSPNQPEEGTR